MTKDKMKGFLSDSPPVIWMLLAIIAVFTFTGSNFYSVRNLTNIIRQASPYLILAIGETLAILVGGIDLSVGYVMSFCGVSVAMLMNKGIPIPVSIIIAIAIGALCGFINGVFVGKFKLPYFIVTYGTGNIVYGLGSLITGGVSQPALSRSFRFIADGTLLGIPVVLLIAIAVFAIMKLVIARTPFGRNMYGLGGNREALFLSGVNIESAEIAVFTATGILTSIAGIIFAARAASGHPGFGVGWEFDAVAAVIIGGSSFSEGRGSINRTVLGVLFIQILKTGLNISGVAPQAQSFLIGLIVVIAISADVLIQRRR